MSKKIIKIKTEILTEVIIELCRIANLKMTDDTYNALISSHVFY